MMRSILLQLGVALAILLIAVGAVVGVSLFSQKLQARALDLEKEVQLKQIETIRVASAKTALPLLMHSEDVISSYTVKTEDIVPFLEQLEKQGKAQGAAIEVLSVQSSKGATGRRITLSLNVTGSFDAVVRTLGLMEYGPHDIFITTVTMTNTAGEAGKPPVWTAGAVFSVGTDGTEPAKK